MEEDRGKLSYSSTLAFSFVQSASFRLLTSFITHSILIQPNSYDAALFINYKAVYNRAPSPQEQVNTIYWKQCSEQFLDDTQATNVVVIGDYKQGNHYITLHPHNLHPTPSCSPHLTSPLHPAPFTLNSLILVVGKTFVLNRISGMLLDVNPINTMEGVKFKRTSWAASDKQEMNVLLIDTEGLNHLPGGISLKPPYPISSLFLFFSQFLYHYTYASLIYFVDATNRDLITRRKGYDQFLQELSIRLGDVPILVTDKPRFALPSSLSFLLYLPYISILFAQRVLDTCALMHQYKKTRTLALVYNMNNIEKKDDFFQFFEVPPPLLPTLVIHY